MGVYCFLVGIIPANVLTILLFIEDMCHLMYCQMLTEWM